MMLLNHETQSEFALHLFRAWKLHADMLQNCCSDDSVVMVESAFGQGLT